jgi:hypothetical protein
LRENWQKYSTELDTLGLSYWANFLKRNPQLRKKRTFKFNQKRHVYCTLQNFKDMYRYMYFHMTRTNVCTKLPEEHVLDIAGEICDKKEKKGRVYRYRMDHPCKVMFVDETGANTNEGKDGNISGMELLTTQEGRPKERSSFQE